MVFSEMMVIAIITGLATAAGGLLGRVLPVGRNGCLAAVLGFAGGVMLGLSFMSLMLQAYFFCGSLFMPVWGFLGGLLLMLLLANVFDHRGADQGGRYKRLGLFIALGIALHNLPEGVALGSGFSGDTSLGFMIAAALALHNIPEGIAIGAPLGRDRSSVFFIFAITALAGLMTPVGAALGWWLADISYNAMGLSMGFAAGAMTYIASHELLGEGIHLHRNWCEAGLIAGLLITYILT